MPLAMRFELQKQIPFGNDKARKATSTAKTVATAKATQVLRLRIAARFAQDDNV